LGVFYSPAVYDWMFEHALNVPEPSTSALLTGLAMATLACRRRRRTSRRVAGFV
jgi:hypothetical protein